MKAIQEYKTLITTDHASALLSCADYQTGKDELLILELSNNNRTTVHKVRVTSSVNIPFQPLFHSWSGSPCNLKG